MLLATPALGQRPSLGDLDEEEDDFPGPRLVSPPPILTPLPLPSPPRGSRAVPIDDAAWDRLLGRHVTLFLDDGRSIGGELESFSPERVMVLNVESDGTRSRLSIVRSSVIVVRAIEVARSVKPVDVTHIGGFSLGLPTGALMLEVEYGGFYAFASFGLASPLVTGGTEMAGFLGVALTTPIGARWHFDLMLLGEPMTSSGAATFGAGVGVGVHLVTDGGITFGLKVPVIGYAFGAPPNDSAISRFFYGAILGLPMLSVGFRF